MTAAARIYAESNGNNSTGSSPRNRGDTRGAQHTHTTHRRSAPMTIVAEGVPGSVELVEQSSSNRFHVPDEDEFNYAGQMQADNATVGASSVVSLEAELNSSMDAVKRE